jgi:hypothetical protein
MSTGSLIGYKIPEKVKDEMRTAHKFISCHFDGYPTYVGRVLLEHYNTPKLVKSLIALGDISSLNENLAPQKDQVHSFSNPAENVTVAYGRDRGEDVNVSRYWEMIDFEMDARHSGCRWVYLYDMKLKQWFFAPIGKKLDFNWKPLTAEDVKEK